MNLQCILKGSCLFSSFICNVPLSKHYFTRRFCFCALAGETCIEPFQPSFGPSKPVVCNVLQNRFSPVTFAKFLRTPFLQNISGGYNWLLSIFRKKSNLFVQGPEHASVLYPPDTGYKLNDFCTFNLRPVSTGYLL